MSSQDAERQRKLDSDFENVFREHDRLTQDLNLDPHQQYQAVLNSIDKWEHDAIKKIEKTARAARHDAQKLLKEAGQELKRILQDTVTEELREVLEEKKKSNEFKIDKWLVYLSEIRKQLENISSVVDFSHDKAIQLIKVKRTFPLKTSQAVNLNHKQFNFEKIRGRPLFFNNEHLISSVRPSIILSQKSYSSGTHYFRFRIEKSTNELFLGIISNSDNQRLKQNNHPIQSIHGWWNIDRRVIGGRKEAYLSALNIYAGDEIILILNCDAREIFLEYPSMSKLNSIKLLDDIRLCPSPWRLLIQTGKPGRCLLRLLDWGLRAHGTNHP